MSAAAVSRDAASSVDAVVLSVRDEVDLRMYFALEIQSPPGARSTFGAMCERIGNARDLRTTNEYPSPDASWTEILACRVQERMGGCDAEDIFIAYLDAKRRIARVHNRVAQLSERDQEILCAHYSRDRERAGALGHLAAVAPLTHEAKRENRARASGDHFESVEQTVDDLAATAKATRHSKEKRDGARETLTAIRREAEGLLESARASYARVR